MLLHLHIYTYLDTSLRATSPRLQTPILRQHRPFFGWRTLAVIIFIFSLVGRISPGFLSPFPDKCRCDGPRSGGRVKQTASVLQSEAFSAKAHKGKVRHRKWSGGEAKAEHITTSQSCLYPTWRGRSKRTGGVISLGGRGFSLVILFLFPWSQLRDSIINNVKGHCLNQTCYLYDSLYFLRVCSKSNGGLASG